MIVTKTFEGYTAGNDLTVDPDWTRTFGAAGIWQYFLDGIDMCARAFGQGIYYANKIGNVGKQTAAVTRPAVATSANQGVGVRLKDDGSYGGYYGGSLTTAAIIYRLNSAGTRTQIGIATGLTNSGPLTDELTADGNALVLAVNGVTRCTATDATHATGRPGLVANSGTNSQNYSSFYANDYLGNNGGGFFHNFMRGD